MKNILIMTIGKTHSGKTTFGEELVKVLPGVIIQSDPLAEFLKDNFPEGFYTDYEHDGSFKNPSLKYKLFITILKHSFKGKFIPIITNANIHFKLRKEIIKKDHKNGYKVVGVYLNYSENILKQRIEYAKRNKKCLFVSANYKALLKKQAKLLAIPQEKEFDYFFEVRDEKEYEKMKEGVLKIV